MKNTQVDKLIDENINLKMILLAIVHEYGDRPSHMAGLYTSTHQPELIKKAMFAVGVEAFGEVPA